MQATWLWWGTQSRTVTGSPNWKLMKDQGAPGVPEPDAKLHATGLEVYPNMQCRYHSTYLEN